MLKQPFVNRTNIDNVKTTMRQRCHGEQVQGEGVAALQQSQAMEVVGSDYANLRHQWLPYYYHLIHVIVYLFGVAVYDYMYM